jgi:hypothetical protein
MVRKLLSSEGVVDAAEVAGAAVYFAGFVVAVEAAMSELVS